MEHEHIYPVFGQGRIMKKELLLALREYSYEALQLQYKNYPDGIISGCGMRVEHDGEAAHTLHIMPGIIKCQGFIFLISEENTIQYQPSAGYISLKFRLIKVEELTDYVRYQWDFVLDGRLRREQGEIELCRFKLKEGAALRTDYKDFYDIQTEYDTVNLADATWSSPGGHTLSKEITDFFAKKVLECGCAQEGDVQFAYFLLQSKEAVNYPILMDYIARKSRGKKQGWGMAKEETPGRDDGGAVDCVEVFGMLAEILDGIRHGGGWKGRRETEGEEGMIVWE
jgi:hypothetical protein